VTSELEVKGSFIDRFTFPGSIGMLSSAWLDVKSLVTDTFPLAEAPQAFDVVSRGTGLKVQIRP